MNYCWPSLCAQHQSNHMFYCVSQITILLVISSTTAISLRFCSIPPDRNSMVFKGFHTFPQKVSASPTQIPAQVPVQVRAQIFAQLLRQFLMSLRGPEIRQKNRRCFELSDFFMVFEGFSWFVIIAK